jgi:alpha-D-ribose 1-methylphosphonate 5-triphosphate diphosphatase
MLPPACSFWWRIDPVNWLISGNQVLRDGALVAARIGIAEDRIMTADPTAGRRFHAEELLVLPGLVDIHGDAHERSLEPRPGVGFPASLALRDSTRQLLCSGITTAFLGVTLSWEPGLRSLAMWRQLMTALDEARATMPLDLRVHLRFEADNLDGLDDALADIAAGRVHLLGFNDHTPSILKKLENPKELAKYAGRSNLTSEAFADLARRIGAQRSEVPRTQARMAAAARERGIPILSHDDAQISDRVYFREHGASICEFPMQETVAENARAHGEHVVMGAPNVVRGGSHLGWASAAALAERGLVTVLASDYHWPALLAAPFVMAQRGVLTLPQAWDLVSRNPAVAAGLTDRGILEPGARADVVVVDPAGPEVLAVWSAGRLSYLSQAGAARLG